MRDCVYLGPTPADEPCEQVGISFIQWRAQLEMRTYIKQLRRQFGEEPEGARIGTKFERGGGGYTDVVVYYDDDNKEAIDYAYKVERESPGKWDLSSLAELGQTMYFER